MRGNYFWDASAKSARGKSLVEMPWCSKDGESNRMQNKLNQSNQQQKPRGRERWAIYKRKKLEEPNGQEELGQYVQG